MPGLQNTLYIDQKRKENIEFAKENMVQCIYSFARLEGINVSKKNIKQLCHGISVGGLPIADIYKINNLCQGWEFVLETVELPLDFSYIQKLNQIVNVALVVPDAGTVRKKDTIVKWAGRKIGVPDRMSVEDEIVRIAHIPSVEERSVRMLLYIAGTRIFSVGNKRTALLAANHILIRDGKGILYIPADTKDEFLKLLAKYCIDKDIVKIRDFVYKNCIFRI
ncbi:MAG: Fic family protein [Lachnospiraceae bacterium]|nr:Fic family protein [Lachnospiraceae bacterium]